MAKFFGVNIFDEPQEAVSIPHYRNTTLTKLDIERAKTHFAGYKRQIEALKKEVQEFEIKTDADAAELTKKANEAKQLAGRLDDERKDQIKEPDSFVRSLNSFVKSFRDILTEPKKKTGLVQIAEQKVSNFLFQKELERRKKEKEAQDAQKKLQAEMDAEAKEAGVTAPQLPPAVLPTKQEPIRTGAGSAHLQTEWVHELKNIAEVPHEYTMLDDKKVKAAIKAGIREIPGLEIKEVPKTQFRKA